jgi:hypothetical protein
VELGTRLFVAAFAFDENGQKALALEGRSVASRAMSANPAIRSAICSIAL